MDTFKDKFFTNYFSNLWAYDLHGLVRNAFDVAKSITKASGSVLGPGNCDFLGLVKWRRAVWRVIFGTQKSQM
jgi:hypothetical protein